jgi:hypothetical protein
MNKDVVHLVFILYQDLCCSGSMDSYGHNVFYLND